MNRRILLLAVGIVLMAAGLWVSTQTIQINEGNQCTVDGGCRNVTANVPSLAPAMLLLVTGIVAAVVGVRRKEDAQ